MRFVLGMAMREMRASWRRLIFFFVCVAIGVGAIVGMRSVIQSVRVTLAGEARTLLAADVTISTSRPWRPEALEAIDRRVSAASVRQRTDAVETATMVRPADLSKPVAKMVELRGVQPAFPLYGDVTLEGAHAYDHALLRGRGALVRPELLTQLGIAVGDEVVIGRETFTVRGVLLTEPGRRLGTFSLGPRVLIDHADLEATGLLEFGSRATSQVLLQVDEAAIEPLVRDLRALLGDDFVRVRSYRATEDRFGDNLLRAENYLSLVGFVILILGGIGVWSVTRVFVAQKLRSIAVLKCVGATSRQVLAVYVTQVLLLGLGGSLLGVGLAAGAVAAVPVDAAEGLGQFGDVSYGLTRGAVAQGLGIGLLVSLLFALVPLLEIRRVKPLLLLRQDTATGLDRARPWSLAGLDARLRAIDWLRVVVAVLVSGALVALASWQAGSLRVGLFVCLGFAGVSVVLYASGLLLVRAVAPLARIRWFPLRHAVVNLGRPGNQTRVILMAVGLGAFFIIGIQALQAGLLRELSLEVRADQPDMFLLDIQEDQAAGVRTFLGGWAEVDEPRLLPVLRARVTQVQGRAVNLEGLDDVRGSGLSREYVVTYRNHLEENEQIVAGRFWGDAPARDASGEFEVSIEEGIQERSGIGVGDLMRFDVLGRPVDARVTSVRHVEWNDARRGGFMFVFRPDTFEGAPHTYIAVLRASADATDRARMQRDLVAAFPNVSVIDVLEVVRTLRTVVDNVTLAVSVVGFVALFSGVLILVGAVAMTKFQRLYEAAVFKTLGASSRTIGTMLVIEYGSLGLLAGAIGSVGAMVLTWSLSRYVLEIPWHAAPGSNLAGVALTTLAVAAIGVAASFDVLRRKPLLTLRAE